MHFAHRKEMNEPTLAALEAELFVVFPPTGGAPRLWVSRNSLLDVPVMLALQ
jgi:hypothetical protein